MRQHARRQILYSFLSFVRMDSIVNKVAESGLITLDLTDFYPTGTIKVFDIKDFLFMGMILKEKDYRAALQSLDWEQYRGTHAGITCSADAIIPMWAYMLPVIYLQPLAASITFGDENAVINQLIINNINNLPVEDYADRRVIIKGCGDKPISEAAYLLITNKLKPVAKSIMYGEACSSVPIYKKK